MNDTNNTPFISTPFLPSEKGASAGMLPIVPPQNATQIQSGSSAIQPNYLESLYPDIYHEIYPIVANVANQIIEAGSSLTPDEISEMVDNIIKNSGLWYEDDDSLDKTPEVVPVQFGFSQPPYRRRRRRHHNRDTLRDIIRILLLRELFGRGAGYPYPFY